jgi:NAD(P)-dependent dehydrogenase (short-subunit alcohol dehydrogenase family)
MTVALITGANPRALGLEYQTRVPFCSASKSAATMLTVQYANLEPGIKFNAVEPGYTATDLTAAFGGGRPAEISARMVVRFATSDPDGPTGTFQNEKGPMSW